MDQRFVHPSPFSLLYFILSRSLSRSLSVHFLLSSFLSLSFLLLCCLSHPFVLPYVIHSFCSLSYARHYLSLLSLSLSLLIFVFPLSLAQFISFFSLPSSIHYRFYFLTTIYGSFSPAPHFLSYLLACSLHSHDNPSR